ncbi:DEAD/DEAH box helicase [Brackiella oedipodis]|uniref:DEAD/DEAH box helicase n=1 Tax=Brackiella oedipodis TaxID=124225 RepID=UPI000AD192EF|nr:DEAD/DEAH box helicase [Brackiella oedipodis]
MQTSSEPQSFTDFGLHPDILKAVAESGYTKPTPIQAQALPVILQGQDVMGAAQTGTGKTAAFTLPVLHRIMPLASYSTSPAKHPVRALVLTPTRELADQVAENVKRYAQHTPIKSAVVFGGVDIKPQKDLLRQGCEFLIATPGRLLDHIEQKTVNLSQVGILVLDEADRMLDMGFMPDIERILHQLPQQRQNLLFSATFSPDIRKLGRSLLQHPTEITIQAQNKTSKNVSQSVVHLPAAHKRAALLFLLKTRYSQQTIVFTNTKLEANRLSRFLDRESIKAAPIHGDKTQQERLRTLEQFKQAQLQVLVATDVAARGLDVAGLSAVINYDLPFNAEDYVHRIGRTGRAGARGEAVSFCSSQDDEQLLAQIETLTKQSIKVQTLNLPEVFLSRAEEQSHHRVARVFSKARLAPIDEFFYKPYEPEQTAGKGPAQPSMKQILEQHKKQEEERKHMPELAVLLGGKPSSHD